MNTQSIAVCFAERLNKVRALTEEESDMLLAVVSLNKATTSTPRWTLADDRKLTKLKQRGWLAARIAEEMGRSRMAVHSRIRLLNRREKARG